MDLLYKIIGIGFVGAIAVVLLRNTKPELTIFVSIAVSAIVLIALSSRISAVISTFSSLAEKSGLESGVFSSILRIIGIGYVTEYASSICDDNGCGSISRNIQLAGKIVIFVMALPLVTGIIDIIEGLVI